MRELAQVDRQLESGRSTQSADRPEPRRSALMIIGRSVEP